VAHLGEFVACRVGDDGGRGGILRSKIVVGEEVAQGAVVAQGDAGKPPALRTVIPSTQFISFIAHTRRVSALLRKVYRP
jgi:hypothetical protein